MSDIYSLGGWFKCSKGIVADLREKKISANAFRLYVVLSSLNNTYGKKQGFFTRRNEQLMEDVGMSDKTLKNTKKELIEKGYIKVWHNKLLVGEGGERKTTYAICYYKLLK